MKTSDYKQMERLDDYLTFVNEEFYELKKFMLVLSIKRNRIHISIENSDGDCASEGSGDTFKDAVDSCLKTRYYHLEE